MNCYFQGCAKKGVTKEHIPPRSFFPENERMQLLTVKSCKEHNNAKSKDDIYALAQICMNASPNNRAREVWLDRVSPQLSHNNGALRRLLSKDSTEADGGVKYQVDIPRLDDFFTALCCGLVFKSQKASLPSDYTLNHIYHNFSGETKPEWEALVSSIDQFYDGPAPEVLSFGKPDTHNERIYTVEIYGLPEFQGSITIVHKFFGVFKVTSMLTRLYDGLGLCSSLPNHDG
jgi:hypothetical protein